MDKQDFPEIDQLELERVKRELAEAKAKVEKYEQVLQEHDLLEVVPSVSDAELICTSQLAKYQKATAAGAVLTLEETKIVDLLVKNLMIAKGKAVPEEKKKKEEKVDLGKLLKLAEGKE